MEPNQSKNWGKTKGIVLLAILLGQLIGFMAVTTNYNAFCASEVYTVDNIIYFNATALGKSETIRLVISKEMESLNEKPDPPIWKLPTKTDINGWNPSPNFTKATGAIENIYGALDLSGESIDYYGFTLNCTNAQKMIIANYNNLSASPRAILENYSDYQSYFNIKSLYYPTNSHGVFFAEPYYYAEQYCLNEGLTLDTIFNATYQENFNMNTLNRYWSELVNTEYIVTSSVNYYSPTLSKGLELWDRLTDEPDSKKCPWCLLAIVVFAIFCLPAISNAVLESQRITATEELAENQIWANVNVTVESIDAEREIQLALVANKATNEQLCLELYQNGSISFEELQILLQGVRGSYDPLINNRTLNIQRIGFDYYNATSELWEDYKQGLGITATWTNYLELAIYAAVALLVIYIIYVFVSRKAFKSNASSAQNTIFVTSPK